MTSRLAFFLLQKTSHSFWKALSIIGCTAWMRLEVARFGCHILWRDVLSRTRLVIIELAVPVYIYICIYILYIFVYDKLYPLVLLYNMNLYITIIYRIIYIYITIIFRIIYIRGW